MSSWITLVVAGIFEVFWALGIKASNGLTKPFASVVTVIFMIASLYLLAVASRQIPINISYTIWVGIGAIGTFLGNIVFFGEKTSPSQLLFFTIIVVGIIGLKLCMPVKN